ncbi:phage portal protein, HK97 family [Rhizobium sp. NFR07]|uniref:phage portal protein n=1 Tax=Rhizobium sp. NFR07 TaxID=1566262 RepID=UPI0008EC5F36|nr:phage portal protein [Rhizobium sp. NFR07]SFB52373.1 phage portal protein, HK97 family [Rhizobium sp. NFR07]
MAGIFGALMRPRAEITSLPMDEWAKLQSGGNLAATGVYVSPETALRYTTVLICVRVLAESVASLPCILYKRRKDGGKDRATEHPLYKVLHDQANGWNSAFEYAEGTMVNLSLRGNGYSYVERNRLGQAIGLIPLNPDGVTITQAMDWSPKYEATMPDNTKAKLTSKDMHHIRGPLPKGYVGRSMISLAREAIGLGMAAESFGSNMYRNGVKPTGVLKHPKVIGPIATENLRQQFSERYAGLENSGKPIILEEGMEWISMNIAPKDAEFIDGRKFQRSEIAGIFRVPAHLVNDLEKATFSNIEFQTLDFIIHSLRPWLVRWEQAINRDLLTERDRAEGYFCEFLIDAMLRGDTKARYEAYSSAIQNKWMSANEARIKENMNPREGGDVFENPAIQVDKPAPSPANDNAAK